MAFYKKLLKPHIVRRIFYERLTEPIHLNLLSLFAGVFGTYRQKVNFDLIVRQPNAWGILKAADLARKRGVPEIAILEFGVAAGAGLLNMARIASRVEQITGVKIRVFGFDTGAGMPPPHDWRDHPEHYIRGDFPMDVEKLRQALPANTQLILGELAQTLPPFLRDVASQCPIGYAVIDVDYYYSSRDALRAFEGPATSCLPVAVLFLDDVLYDDHNSKSGQLLAVSEFNSDNPLRVIEQPQFMETFRVFKRAPWLKQIRFLHVMDHPVRQTPRQRSNVVLANPYL